MDHRDHEDAYHDMNNYKDANRVGEVNLQVQSMNNVLDLGPR